MTQGARTVGNVVRSNYLIQDVDLSLCLLSQCLAHQVALVLVKQSSARRLLAQRCARPELK